VQDNARKSDTIHKIQLGGLVIKAGLGTADKAVLLGLLVDAREALKRPGELERLRRLGDAEFGAKSDARTTTVDAG
jgi:Conjugal transfer protein TraD